MINGHTRVIAHIGFPTSSFKAPMIYNPWFNAHGVNAIVVPFGVQAEDYEALFPGLGMNKGDPLPVDIDRVAPGTFVGEVVMKEEFTPLLRAASAKGCTVQTGTDMLFEMIPAYLEFFGFGTATPEELRRLATLEY